MWQLKTLILRSRAPGKCEFAVKASLCEGNGPEDRDIWIEAPGILTLSSVGPLSYRGGFPLPGKKQPWKMLHNLSQHGSSCTLQSYQ
jgi:hypothetical protein